MVICLGLYISRIWFWLVKSIWIFNDSDFTSSSDAFNFNRIVSNYCNSMSFCKFKSHDPPSFYALGHAMFPPFQHYLLYNHQICIQTHQVKIILNKLKAINAIPIYCACIILKIILNGSGGVMKSKFKLKRNHLN